MTPKSLYDAEMKFQKMFDSIEENSCKIVAMEMNSYVLCNDMGKMRFFKLN